MIIEFSNEYNSPQSSITYCSQLVLLCKVKIGLNNTKFLNFDLSYLSAENRPNIDIMTGCGIMFAKDGTVKGEQFIFKSIKHTFMALYSVLLKMMLFLVSISKF